MEVAVETVPGVTETVGKVVDMFEPPSEAEIVLAVPARTPVNVAE